jgi:hypothetical protein
MTSFLRTDADDPAGLQAQMDAAVVIPTMLRPSLVRTLQSIFAQQFGGRIQILIGVDKPIGELAVLDEALAGRPANCYVQVLYPGYSTSARNGGLCPAYDGGVLRCILTYLANSRYVAYLDDDNWWAPSHLELLRRAIETAEWAFALRWFVHPDSGRPIAIDKWESVGPGKGIFAASLGGFVDPSCLMIDKTACPDVMPCWNYPLLAAAGGTADRRVFDVLHRHHRGAGTGVATSYYRIDPADPIHADRVRRLAGLYDAAAADGDNH